MLGRGGFSERSLREVEGIFIPGSHFSEAFQAALLSSLRPVSSHSITSPPSLPAMLCSAVFSRQRHLETPLNMVTKLFRQTACCLDVAKGSLPPPGVFFILLTFLSLSLSLSPFVCPSMIHRAPQASSPMMRPSFASPSCVHLLHQAPKPPLSSFGTFKPASGYQTKCENWANWGK